MNKFIIGLLVLGLSLGGAVVYGQESDIPSVLLLRFNGTDGSQNFTDRAHNHRITAYGDAQIDTAQYKFGGTSGFFDGDGDYLSIPDSADWNFGAGDFTIDFWVKFNALDNGGAFFNQYESDTDNSLSLVYNSNEQVLRFRSRVGDIFLASYTAPWSPSPNIWYHLAVVRNGTVFYIFIDGVSQPLTELTAIGNNVFPDLDAIFEIGAIARHSIYYFDGWLDEFTVSKGIARWTSDFTPPKEEYHISSQIAYAGGDRIVEEKQLVILDGSASSVLSGNIAYDWTRISGPQVVLSDETIANPAFTAPEVDLDTNLEFELVVTDIDTGERSKVDYLTITVKPIVEVLESDIPSVLLLHFNGTDGTQNFTDRAHNHRVTAYGDAQIDTAQYKFGGTSGFFDGDGDYLSIPDSADWNFGAGDFTIYFWLRLNDISGSQDFIHQYGDETHWWQVSLNTWHHLSMHFKNVTNAGEYFMIHPWFPDTNKWYHLAFVRNGTTGLIFIDGVSQPITEETSFFGEVGDVAGPLSIGCSGVTNGYFDGWMDELRISKGIARWTSDFTPPTEEYYLSPSIANTGENLIVEEKQLVILDGSASSVLSGNIAYDWTRISGPQVVLSDETIANPAFTAPEVDLDTNLEFELVVTDIDTGKRSKVDYLTITVKPIVEVPVVEIEQPVIQDRSVKSVSDDGIWSILTNKRREAKPAVKAILLAILALVIFFFIYMNRRTIKSTEEK